MRSLHKFLFLALALCVFAGCAHLAEPPAGPVSNMRPTDTPTALDRYVAKADPSYGYTLISTTEGEEVTSYVLEMTSQTWRSADEVDQPVWKHWLTIACPKKPSSKTAFILISGGHNGDDPPRAAGSLLRQVAKTTNTIVSEVLMIPNEPLKFADEDKKRSEDSLIAYTWDKYLHTGDEEWPARLPMTKAVVRAMDTVQTFCAGPEVGHKQVDSFVVAGGSKRGWTTWTVAAVDKRVIACAPIVIDVLNILPSFAHHWSVYGGWAPAINDYVKMDAMNWLGSKEFESLLSIVDPYCYLDRLTMPKLLVNACDDQFFVPTSSQFYINDLKGPTYLCYVPNVGHGACGKDGMESLMSFYSFIITGQPMPTYKWTFPDAGTIRIETPSKPISVQLWQATNPEARDFRLDKFGKGWTATTLEDQGGGVYVGQVAQPEKGWTAYMVQLAFDSPVDATFKCSSPVRVIPDTLEHSFPWPEAPTNGFLSKEGK